MKNIKCFLQRAGSSNVRIPRTPTGSAATWPPTTSPSREAKGLGVVTPERVSTTMDLLKNEMVATVESYAWKTFGERPLERDLWRETFGDKDCGKRDTLGVDPY
ncbi:unnamed protein product [Ectocarpus sp. 4 AP-2014]